MSFNRPYGTRNSGRYNTPGHFVPAEQLPGSPMQRRLDNAQRINTPNANINNSPVAALQQPPQFQPPQQPNMQALQVNDVEMKADPSAADSKADGVVRPPWMDSKLAGVKKISNKERRRRQNAHLRRLLSPKNALMALNELLLNEQIPNEFRVQQAAPAQFYNQSANMFCAELTVEGRVYKGYGETKITARNAAAEQAIRDIMIKKMSKIFNPEGSVSGEGGAVGTGTGGTGTGATGTGGTGTDVSGAGGAAGGDEEALPMIQLASFALHKLFTEWECEGHKVPHLKPAPPPSEADMMGGDKKMVLEPRPKKKSKPRELPINAAAMHPCMLLTYMRPTQEYQDFATEGDRPQNMLFTIGVEVDGQVFLGKAPNKKEARKAAAKAACAALFNVSFQHNATDTAPVHAHNDQDNNSNTNDNMK